MSKHALFVSVCSCVCLLACNSSVEFPPAADSQVSAKDLAAYDLENPTKIIQAFEKTLQALPAYSCKLRTVIHLKTDDMDKRMVSDYLVQIEQPRRWAIVKQSGMIGGTSVSDGRHVTSYIPMLQRYAVEDLPEDGLVRSLVTGPAETMGMMGPAALASLFLGHGLADWMLDGVNKSEHLGSDLIDGVECQHYRYSRKEGTPWELWVQVGEQVLIRKFQMQPEAPEAGEAMQEMSLGMQLEFAEWDTAAKFLEADFAFDPPAGANKVEDLLGGVGEPQPHRLIGQQAPTFEVQSLVGDPFKLADHLGQKIIVLDFWATWCSPCTAALPGLARVSKQFEGQDVLVYAVNQGEEAEVVQRFLSKAELELSVLLDFQGSIGEMYAVDGIPMTAVIGKDKRVQVVHVGFSQGMEKKLSREIGQLLRGEDLAARTAGEAEDQRTDGG